MGELLTRGAVLLETAAVRKLTENATQDELAEADYFEIYRRLRGDKSLSKFADDLKAAYPDAPSKAELGRWENGEVEARRRLRNALRAMDGRDLLPDTVAEVMTEHVHPDAKVFFLGDNEVAEVVLLVGDISLWNSEGASTIAESSTVESSAAARAQRRYYRPCLPDELKGMVEDSGESVEELIRYALEMKRREV
jgi:hypothetical protein